MDTKLSQLRFVTLQGVYLLLFAINCKTSLKKGKRQTCFLEISHYGDQTLFNFLQFLSLPFTVQFCSKVELEFVDDDIGT